MFRSRCLRYWTGTIEEGVGLDQKDAHFQHNLEALPGAVDSLLLLQDLLAFLQLDQ